MSPYRRICFLHPTRALSRGVRKQCVRLLSSSRLRKKGPVLERVSRHARGIDTFRDRGKTNMQDLGRVNPARYCVMKHLSTTTSDSNGLTRESSPVGSDRRNLLKKVLSIHAVHVHTISPSPVFIITTPYMLSAIV